MGWRPISELKPVLGESYVVAWPDGNWSVVMWKENPRWPSKMEDCKTDEEKEFLAAHPQPYFGDPVELDDYDMARPSNAPVLYLPFEDPPCDEAWKWTD